jgi:hypothetical protein
MENFENRLRMFKNAFIITKNFCSMIFWNFEVCYPRICFKNLKNGLRAQKSITKKCATNTNFRKLRYSVLSNFLKINEIDVNSTKIVSWKLKCTYGS